MPKNPSDTRKAVLSIQYLSCQAQERYWAQRSVRVPLGRKKSNGKNTFFLFPILSFSCKRKNGRRKKNAIQDRFALFHSAAFGGTHGGLLRNAACPSEIRRRADDIRPYEKDPALEYECRGAACCSRFAPWSHLPGNNKRRTRRCAPVRNVVGAQLEPARLGRWVAAPPLSRFQRPAFGREACNTRREPSIPYI